MPILDQGYQHWNGPLAGHAGRWLTITRHGVLAQVKNRWVQGLLASALVPALILASFLVIWGLFEQKSAVLTPFLFFFEGLPDELRSGPKGFRSTFWTLAFSTFFEVQVFFSMLLVLLVGPGLISQDLRFNAIPLYLARPIRRIDYFAGKLGVIACFLVAVMIMPAVVAYALGFAFSLDPLTIRDTWRLLAASIGFGAIVVASAGLLMLAISSLSRNSRYVGVMWVGLWVVGNVASGVLTRTIHREWTPLLSYTANLHRLRDALLGTEAAWERVNKLFEAGNKTARRMTGPLAIVRGGRPGRKSGLSKSGPPMPPRPDRAAPAASAPPVFPWEWSAGVLAGLGVVSAWILSTRVRSLDRLR